MFVDKALITVTGGKGGDGAVAFHREKYVAAGGPDGGDGGRGGDVIAVVDAHMSTLMDFRYQRKYAAGNGDNGSGRLKSGRDGENVTIRVPRGTLIRDKESGGVMRDMSDGEPYVIAKGGRGGWGNKHFATPTRQAPRFAKPGLPGEKREIVLELKLLADVGLAGFPNAGKSTLLKAATRARPKIADYPFTTLYPNLGVVGADSEDSFVLADIPGIIEGASEGAGLGYAFLRHIDRCRLLLHIVDVSGSEGRDPVEDVKVINAELSQYGTLAERPQFIVANKSDLFTEGEVPGELCEYARSLDLPYFEISAATGAGVSELMRETAAALKHLPPITVYEPDYVPTEWRAGTPDELEITNTGGVWTVEGEWIDRLMYGVNFSDYEQRMYFDRVLRDTGVFARMEALGVKDGDTVCIYDLEFEYLSDN